MRRSATDIENIPIPPLGIIKLVTGTPDVEWFIETGKRASIAFLILAAVAAAC
jgi:hypothetical protein